MLESLQSGDRNSGLHIYLICSSFHPMLLRIHSYYNGQKYSSSIVNWKTIARDKLGSVCVGGAGEESVLL